MNLAVSITGVVKVRSELFLTWLSGALWQFDPFILVLSGFGKLNYLDITRIILILVKLGVENVVLLWPLIT
jgi:hypothetical protein